MLEIVLEEKRARKENDNIPNKVGSSRESLYTFPLYSLFGSRNWPLMLRGSLVVVKETQPYLYFKAEGIGSA